MTWAPGVGLLLPSGRRIRGRGLSHGLPDGPLPEFGLYLLGMPPDEPAWPYTWVPWRDFRLPLDRDAARAAFVDALERARTQRVEVACSGGRGRTGTALACIAILDGVAPHDAVAYVREHYLPKAVETPWQRRYVRHFR